MDTNAALALSASKLLAILSPHLLFERDKASVEELKKRLQSKWHPDKNGQSPESAQVFAHVRKLYETAMEQLEAGVWGQDKFIKFIGAKNSDFIVSYLKSRRIDGFGVQYLGRKYVTYHGDASVLDLGHKWIQSWGKLKKKITADSTLTKYFPEYPQVEPVLHLLEEDEFLIRVPIPAGYVCLEDVVHTWPGGHGLPPEHVMWILSRLYGALNLCAITDVPNLSLNPSGIFIHPAQHSLMLLEGWQYCSGFEEKALAAPARTVRISSTLTKSGKPSHSDIGRLIRKVGKDCAKDPSGVRLLKDGTWPKELRSWLLSSDVKSKPTDEFAAWEKARDAAMPKKFVEMRVDTTTLYA